MKRPIWNGPGPCPKCLAMKGHRHTCESDQVRQRIRSMRALRKIVASKIKQWWSKRPRVHPHRIGEAFLFIAVVVWIGLFCRLVYLLLYTHL
jgi:hypothetical protein